MKQTATIGGKIKELRTSQHLTLKQLSEKTGLSTGLLSQLERGISSIAIDSLENIAKALDVNLTTFLGSPPTASIGPIVYSFEHQYNQTASCIVETVLNHNAAAFEMLPRITLLMPQANTEEEIELYRHSGEEFIYVLEGTVTILLDYQKYILNPGDCVQFKSNLSHNWINNTNKIVKLLTINMPSPFYGKKE